MRRFCLLFVVLLSFASAVLPEGVCDSVRAHADTTCTRRVVLMTDSQAEKARAQVGMTIVFCVIALAVGIAVPKIAFGGGH